jgi:hypothetical protein
MPRAGSGWYYNLLHDLVVSDGGQDARLVRNRYQLGMFLTEVNCNISTLSFHRLIPVLLPTELGNRFVIKTHAGPTRYAKHLISNKRIYVIYIYRDPRAALLSAFEYGQKAIMRDRPNAFSHLKSLEDAAEFIRFYLEIWDAWSKIDDVLVIRYEDLLSDYQGIVETSAKFLDLSLDNPATKQVIQNYEPGKGASDQVGTHFSKGEAERFRREINPDQLAYFTQMFEPMLLGMGYEK